MQIEWQILSAWRYPPIFRFRYQSGIRDKLTSHPISKLLSRANDVSNIPIALVSPGHCESPFGNEIVRAIFARRLIVGL